MNLDLTAYDWLLARRTLGLGIALGALVFVVMISTDDAMSTLAGRLGRLAALSSLAGGGAAFIATEQARSRGEMRALGAAGVAPVKAALGPLVGGSAIGVAGAILALVRRVDLAPLFPRASSSGESWVAQGGAWLETTRGIVVRSTGELSSTAPALGRTLVESPAPRVATVLALALSALGFPLWAVARESGLRRSLVALGVAASSVTIFHLVAADRMHAVALLVAPALLLGDAFALHRSGAWSGRNHGPARVMGARRAGRRGGSS